MITWNLIYEFRAQKKDRITRMWRGVYRELIVERTKSTAELFYSKSITNPKGNPITFRTEAELVAAIDAYRAQPLVPFASQPATIAR